MDWAFVLSAASLLVCTLSFLYFKAYLKRRTGQERILSEIRAEVGKLIAEIDFATDRDVQLVEDRVTSLKALLAEIDARIGGYRREIGREEKAPAVKAAPAATRPPAVESPPPPAQAAPVAPPPEPAEPSMAQQAAALHKAGFSTTIIAARLGVSVSEVEMVINLFGH